MATLLRQYEGDLDTLNRQQKQLVEKAEQQHEIDLKFASKKIRSDQEREVKLFKEALKSDQKLLKQEVRAPKRLAANADLMAAHLHNSQVDLLPKDKRRDIYRVRKDKLEAEQNERERDFIRTLNESHDMSMKRLSESHREKIALLERQFLQQKQQLLRAREAAIWEAEVGAIVVYHCCVQWTWRCV